MTIYYIVAILAGIAGLITPLTYLYSRLVKPIKKMMRDQEDNKRDIECVKTDLKKLEGDIERRDTEAAENRTITIKSLVTILEVLQQHGANGDTHQTKKDLIKHIAKRAGRPRK